jgi:hypothetical protein
MTQGIQHGNFMLAVLPPVIGKRTGNIFDLPLVIKGEHYGIELCPCNTCLIVVCMDHLQRKHTLFPIIPL